MEKSIDNGIINTGIAVKAAGSPLVGIVLKSRKLILASGLSYFCVICFSHSVKQPQAASLFTWMGVIAGIATLVLLVNIFENSRFFNFHEFEHVDHKSLPKDEGLFADL